MASDNPEIHTEEIALFSRPPVNVAEDRISWHEIRPSYMSNAEYSSINFSILGNSCQYLKLSDSELYVRITRVGVLRVGNFFNPLPNVQVFPGIIYTSTYMWHTYPTPQKTSLVILTSIPSKWGRSQKSAKLLA